MAEPKAWMMDRAGGPEPDVNRWWEYVKLKYPKARFVHWFPDGELHFYPDGKSEKEQTNLGSCYRNDKGQLVARTGESWGK